MRRKIIHQSRLIHRSETILDVYTNLRKWGQCTLLAICDADLIGKTLRQGKIVFHIRKEFYKGNLVNLEEAVSLIQQSTIVNMVGQKIVKKALKMGLIHADAVLEIDGIPHAQILKL